MDLRGNTLSGSIFHPINGVRISLAVIGDDYEHANWRFDQPAPITVTEVLHDCLCHENGEKIPQAEIWQWRVDQRIQALISLIIASNRNHCAISVTCPHQDCKELMDLNFDLTSLPKANDTADFTVTLASSDSMNSQVKLRHPNGNDQLQWLQEATAGKPVDEIRMANDLVVTVDGKPQSVDWQIPRAWLPEIEKALTEYDPYTDFQIKTKCPNCSHTFDVVFDIEEHLLGVLQGKWCQLMEDMHLLAANYHWSERDIFNVPMQRRQYYLNCIQEAMSL